MTNEDCFMYKIICLNNFTLSGIFEVFDSILCNNIFINYGGYENEEIASKFFAGGGATATISGLILAGALVIGFMMSCGKDNSSQPTTPNIPLYPASAPSENSDELGFYSSKGSGQFSAWVGDSSEFRVGVPAGDFLMTYDTTAGTYYLAFRASNTAVLHIGMLPSVRAVNVSVQQGNIMNVTVNKWESSSVTLFSWPGSGVIWNGVFQSNVSIAAVIVIRNGQVVSGISVLPGPNDQPNPKPTATPIIKNPTPTPTPAVTPTTTPTPSQTEKVMLPGAYHDAEKLTGEDGSMMCWAAAPANALMWGGWADAGRAYFDNAQDVFLEFQEHWFNTWMPGGPGPKDSIRWWFSGDDALSDSIKTYIEIPGGGNYWPTDLSPYYSEEAFSLENVNAKIREQAAVMIKVTNDGDISGHWFNVWGFERDTNKPNEEYLYITDNEDGDANNPTPKRVTAKLVNGVWRLSDYTYNRQTGWDIGGTMGFLKMRRDCPISVTGVPLC